MSYLNTTLVCLCLLLTASGFSQKLSYGVGVAANYGFFIFEGADQLTEVSFSTMANVSPAASFILDYNGTGTFSMRLQPVLTAKKIRFIEEMEGVKRSEANYLNIEFVALDLGITGRFILSREKWLLTPFAGLNVSINKYIDAEYRTRGGSGADLIVAQIAQGSTFGSPEFFVQPGLIAGMGIGTLNGKLELEAKLVYTPVNFVNGDGAIPFSNTVNLPLAGKFQYIGVGVNYKFD